MGLFSAIGDAFGGNERRAKVWIVFDNHKGSYYGGEELAGTVYLDVVKDGFKAESLSLTLTGQEHTLTHWQTHEGSGENSKTVDHYQHQRRNVVSIPVNLDHFDYKEPMHKGMRREYKFAFKLPDVLPPTISSIHGGGGYAELGYSVVASCTTPGKMWSGEVNHSMTIFVSGGPGNPAPPSQLPAQMEPLVVPVKVCCCISKGEMTVGARADKTVLSPMETITVRSAIKNNSTATVSSVVSKLTQHANWSYCGHHNNSTHTAAMNQGNPAAFKGAGALSKEELKKCKGYFDNVIPDLVQELEGGGGYECTLTMDGATTFSYYGQLFSVSHSVSVTSMTGCCITNPTVGTQVVVCAKPGDRKGFTEFAKPAVPEAVHIMPDDWASTMERKEVNMSSVEAYYGGKASEPSEDGEMSTSYAVAVSGGARTYETLLQEMSDSVFDTDIVKRYIKESFMGTLDTSQLSALVKNINDVFGRSDVAMLFMNALTRPIVSADCIAVMPHIETTSQKSSFVQAMLPKITDLDSGNKARIKGSLSAFEALLVGRGLD